MADLFTYENGANTLAFVIMTFVVGIVLACCVMLYQIKVPGKIVRALLRADAIGEKNAVDAAVLGIQSNRLLCFLLKDTGALAKYVKVIPRSTVGEGKQKRPNYTDALYYLVPETKYRAQIRYEEKRATVPALISAIVLFTLLGILLNFVIPDLIQMLKNFLSMFQSE